jgi:hypothetical protein
VDSLGSPQVFVHCDIGEHNQCKKVSFYAPIEMYSMQNAREHEHQFDYGAGGTTPSIVTLLVPPLADFLSSSFSILRVTNPIFHKHFGKMQVSFGPIICFTLKYGEQSELQDGICGGCQIDCGCAAQSYTENSDHTWAPKTAVGFTVFEKITDETERNTLLSSFGCIQDCIQVALDEIHTLLGLPLFFNYPPRVAAYTANLREPSFFADHFRMSTFTIQVKYLSGGDMMKTHKEKCNCPWETYATTAVFCVIGSNSFGTIWSVKFIVNSRAAVGSLFEQQVPIDESLCFLPAKATYSNWTSPTPNISGPIMDEVQSPLLVGLLSRTFSLIITRHGKNLL